MRDKDIAAFYFKPVGGELDKYKCRCGQVIKQRASSGSGNLASHVRSKHKNYEDVMKKERGNGTNNEILMTYCVSDFSRDVYGWMDLTIGNFFPFTFVENNLVRQYCKLKAISRNTLLKYYGGVKLAVEEKLTEEMPPHFGLLFDGWSDGSGSHYVAIFAEYTIQSPEGGSVTKRPLLSCGPLLDETSLNAQNHIDYFDDVLHTFDKSLRENVVYFVGDNCATNKAISRQTDIPLIGCASHRFQLAVKTFYSESEKLLDKIDKLMVKLRTVKHRGQLRAHTDVAPQRRNATRWTSTYTMLKSFFKLRQYIPHSADLVKYLPDQEEEQRLSSLYEDLKKFESCSKKLQDDSLTMSQVRALFDKISALYPMTRGYLSSTAQIVECQDFENGIVKVQNGEVLADVNQSAAVQMFLTQRIENDEDTGAENNAVHLPSTNFADDILHEVLGSESEMMRPTLSIFTTYRPRPTL